MKRFFSTIIAISLISLALSCSNDNHNKSKDSESTKVSKPSPAAVAHIIKAIESDEQFKQLLDESADRLLIFDLYADWCQPCKILTPTLEELANENRDKADFYKVNIDKHRKIASMFGVKGIPFIVFVKNGKGVHALTGVQPKATYQTAINKYYADTP